MAQTVAIYGKDATIFERPTYIIPGGVVYSIGHGEGGGGERDGMTGGQPGRGVGGGQGGQGAGEGGHQREQGGQCGWGRGGGGQVYKRKK